jgi:hypothetical protein
MTGALMQAKERAAKDRAYFKDPKVVADYASARKRNEMDVKFCWK